MAKNRRPKPEPTKAHSRLPPFAKEVTWTVLFSLPGVGAVTAMLQEVPLVFYLIVPAVVGLGVWAWDNWSRLSPSDWISRQILPALYAGALTGLLAGYLWPSAAANPDDANGGFSISGTQFLLETASSPPKARVVVRFRNAKSYPIRYEFESASISVDGKPVVLSPYLKEDILPPTAIGTWIPAELPLDDTRVVQVTISYVVRYGFDGRPFTYRQKLQQVCPTMLDPKKFYANQCTRIEMANEKIASN